MFIPRGTILYENLATSYVLVDSLVADLCEGGFSGVVEVTLRRADAHVVIARGRVAASLLAQHSETTGSLTDYSRSTVVQIAAAAREERGCVSIYRYSADNAEAIAGRATAEALYTRLSTEFADLEKVITKLSREGDRQWFIEIMMASGLAALVHIKNDRCRVLTARDGALREAYESETATENAALAALLDESRQLGGVFDVYFRSASDVLAAGDGLPETLSKESHKTAEATGDVSEVVKEAKAVFQSLSLDDTIAAPSDHPSMSRALPALRELTGSLGETTNNGDATSEFKNARGIDNPPSPARPSDNVNHPTFFRPAIDMAQRPVAGDIARSASENREELFAATDDDPLTTISEEPQTPMATLNARRSTNDLLLMPDDLRATGLLKRGSRAEVLAEIKRLMGEIVRTVEESIRAAGSRDSFTLHLRAGQLKVAERYAFLDPFGGEFEYLAGEIVFVGDVGADDFIVGLSEALAQAIDNAARASAQPDRLRLHVAEGLRWLLNRQSNELELYHLDQAIEAIIAETGSGTA
ncbi:MAG: tRNA wybutosine-synthesizing protein 1 [Blastocatellia bacterium]